MKSSDEIIQIVAAEFRKNGTLALKTKSLMEAAVLSGDIKEADAMYTQHKQYQANYVLLADLMTRITAQDTNK